MLKLKTARLQPSKTTTPKATLTAKSPWLTAHASTQTSSRQSRRKTLSASCKSSKSHWAISITPALQTTLTRGSKNWRKSQPSSSRSSRLWMKSREIRFSRHLACPRCGHSSSRRWMGQEKAPHLCVWSQINTKSRNLAPPTVLKIYCKNLLHNTFCRWTMSRLLKWGTALRSQSKASARSTTFKIVQRFQCLTRRPSTVTLLSRLWAQRIKNPLATCVT